MTRASIVLHLEIDADEVSKELLKEVVEASLVPAIEDDWTSEGRNLAGYEGPFVTSVIASHNGVEL